jgi:two-component system, NtrC family, response regulator HydG
MSRGRVAVVDDDEATREMLEEALGHRGFQVSAHGGPAAVLRELDAGVLLDAVLTDLRMGEASGLDLCTAVRDRDPTVPVIVITAFGSIRMAVEAMRTGAYDFITKPFDVEMVTLVLDRAIHHSRLSREVRALRSSGGLPALAGMQGDSAAMRRVFETIERIASSDATVLISGESGTGKELAAQALHTQSPRKDEPFVAINCAAIPEALLESELFGHVKGAFTDARSERQGIFVKAGAGTLFLDEIGDMPLGMQAKLLRALQDRRVRPVGSEREIPFEARLVAATHRDLEVEVASGRFRQDLFFRIHVIEILLPPLRARGSDVLSLATSFIERHSQRAQRPGLRLSHAAAARLLAYDWPGNVRELENCIERAVALSRADEIDVEDLPERIRRGPQDATLVAASGADELVSLEEMERRYILRVLRAMNGNKKMAAQVLDLDRSTLYRKLERYGSDG